MQEGYIVSFIFEKGLFPCLCLGLVFPMNDPCPLISVPIMHRALLAGWAPSMALYELALFDPSDPLLDPMWRQGHTFLL